ncbi:MAG: hypothetical protein II852_03325 [Bacteroidales bacterium]|nr:hypothetical protein [Bacteroidales bacterium]
MKAKLIATLIVLLWSCAAYAQDMLMLGWKINDISVRTGRNIDEMNQKTFTYVGHPEGKDDFIIKFPPKGMKGQIKYGDNNNYVFSGYETEVNNENKSIFFNIINEDMEFGLFLGKTDNPNKYQDVACIIFYKDNIVIQFIYTLRRIYGFD